MLLFEYTGRTLTESTHPGANLVAEHADHILVLCHMLSNRIGRSFSRELSEHNVSPAEWRVMLDLIQYDKASGRSISARWAMDKMAVSRAIGSLERRGWVQRHASSLDKRSKELTMTSAGREAYVRILPTANKHYQVLLSGIDKASLAQCRDVLLRIIQQADASTT